MMKKFFILLIVIFAIVVFTTLATFIAPYMITFIGQVLYDKWQIIRYESEVMLVYNWLLGFITLVLCAITFVLFHRNRLRIYTLLFIPHIVSLVIAMFYIGFNIRYLGDGFICVESPFSSYRDYRNSKGKVIMSISYASVSKEYRNDEIVFIVSNYSSLFGIDALYNEDGICFLRKPHDDEYMKSYSDFYYSKRDYDKDNHFDHCRVRFFDKYGNYIITREYGLGGYYPDRESELLSEYSEEVDELSNGIKRFKIKFL